MRFRGGSGVAAKEGGVDVADEARGHGHDGLAVAEAGGGMGEHTEPLGAGDGDIEQPAFFLNFAGGGVGHGGGEEVLLDSDDEYIVEFKAFGGMGGHEGDALGGLQVIVLGVLIGGE